VVVTYDKSDNTTFNALKTRLQQIYGASTESDFEVNTIEVGHILLSSANYNDETIVFGKFSPEIKVILSLRKVNLPVTGDPYIDAFYNGFRSKVDCIRVYYVWKKFWDDYEDSKLGL